MKSAGAVAVALLLSGCGTLAPSHPGTVAPSYRPPLAPSLAVISWNLNSGSGDLPRLLADLSEGRLTGIPPNNYVLLLQEATGDRISGLSWFFVPILERDGRSRGNAIHSTVPLVEPRAIPLPRERQPRAAVSAVIDIEGVQLTIVNVHLENRVTWWRGGLLSENARGRQAEALLAALPPDTPGVLGGDLNTWLGPTEPAWKVLTARFPDLPPRRRDVSFRDRLALDHVLFDLPPGWIAERRVLPDRYGSDHHPVLGLLTAP